MVLINMNIHNEIKKIQINFFLICLVLIIKYTKTNLEGKQQVCLILQGIKKIQ